MHVLAPDAIAPAITVEDFLRRVPYMEADADSRAAIEAYLVAATVLVEGATNRPVGRRAVEFDVSGPRSTYRGVRRWWFPLAPVVEVTEVEVRHAAGTTVLDAGHWGLVRGQTEPCLELRQERHLDSLRVSATVGAEVDRQQAPVIQAIVLLAKQWFDAGVAIGEIPKAQLSFGVTALIRQARYRRPREFA